ncbi:hypothetical protein PCASD_08459 [Puccinia coronata f. sp. avenae]|uniref:Uncharacterized protein n=1 Tax=Puccinia coronata f. sp. avenae TaxID=200324 RepID=A0A2N5TDL9_9BASI|nr:hypothetical protein PCASD_11405 [Puccinia coronata f. sp. avenae]PLW38982.1 hypothetical protein PCASD_08459 [Puccinia coronata f. sp. avenae]
MAKLTDLPAELINRIVHHVLFSAPQPATGEDEDRPKRKDLLDHDHHLLDHTQLDCALKPKPRPHRERLPNPQGHKHDPALTYAEPVSWPEGPPDNPLLPLCLVNRTFRQYAQELLFKNVGLDSKWTASLFLKSLTCVPSHDHQSLHTHPNNDNQLQAMQAESPRVCGLSQHVRSLQFSWGKECSMGQGGGSMFCKIIQSCPFLENIAISNTFLLACKEPILNALATRPRIKELVILNNTRREHSTFQWQAHEVVSRLFSRWDHLETVELSGLACWPDDSPEPAPASIPTMNCAIRTMILKDHDLDEPTLSSLIKSCADTLRTLEVTDRGHKLDRGGFCRVLQGCTSPNLECLTIHESICWQPPLSSNLHSDDPLTSPGLLDIVFNSPEALNNLKTLSFQGTLATGRLFERLPKSIVKLAWERCNIPASPLIRALSTSRDNEGPLPNLKCCSVRSRYGWDPTEKTAVQQALQLRGGCFHSTLNRSYGSPAPSDDDSDDDHYVHMWDPFEDDEWEGEDG